MTDKLQTPSQTSGTQVRELTPDELDHVSAGAFRGGVTVAAADFNNDGAVDAADYVVWRKTDSGI